MSNKLKFVVFLLLISVFHSGCNNPAPVTSFQPKITKDTYIKLALCAVEKTNDATLKDAWKQNSENVKKIPDSQWNSVVATPSYESLLDTYSKLGCK